jgi:hypothetical protein
LVNGTLPGNHFLSRYGASDDLDHYARNPER